MIIASALNMRPICKKSWPSTMSDAFTTWPASHSARTICPLPAAGSQTCSRASGPADYALFVGLTLAGVVEAKRRRKNVSAAIDQAERYSSGVADRIHVTPRCDVDDAAGAS